MYLKLKTASISSKGVLRTFLEKKANTHSASMFNLRTEIDSNWGLWKFRGFLHKEHMAVKDERLVQARDEAAQAKNEAKSFGAKLVQAEAQITKLMTANVLPEKASATANSTASIFQYLRTSNATLQTTLSRHLELMGSPTVLLTKKSNE
jgi:hypothetical protein